MGFRVWGLGFRVWGLVFRVLGFFSKAPKIASRLQLDPEPFNIRVDCSPALSESWNPESKTSGAAGEGESAVAKQWELLLAKGRTGRKGSGKGFRAQETLHLNAPVKYGD